METSTPTITTTIGRLVTAEQALLRVAQLDLVGDRGYHVYKLLKLVLAETAFFKEKQSAWVKELGAPRESTPAEIAAGQTDMIEVTPANKPTFYTRINEAAAVEVLIAWPPIPMSWLTGVSGADRLALEPLLFDDMEAKG